MEGLITSALLRQDQLATIIIGMRKTEILGDGVVENNRLNKIDFSTVILDDFFDCLADDDKQWAEAYLSEAKQYLLSFTWCKMIEESYLGALEPSCFAVFLFKIRPSTKEIDKWLWVVVGDIPPAYLVCDLAPNPISALNSYIFEMRRWVYAVENGLSTEELIPVTGPEMIETAKALASRLDLIQEYTELEHKHQELKESVQPASSRG